LESIKVLGSSPTDGQENGLVNGVSPGASPGSKKQRFSRRDRANAKKKVVTVNLLPDESFLRSPAMPEEDAENVVRGRVPSDNFEFVQVIDGEEVCEVEVPANCALALREVELGDNTGDRTSSKETAEVLVIVTGGTLTMT